MKKVVTWAAPLRDDAACTIHGIERVIPIKRYAPCGCAWCVRRVSDDAPRLLPSSQRRWNQLRYESFPPAIRLHQATFGKHVNSRDSSLVPRASPRGASTPDSHPAASIDSIRPGAMPGMHSHSENSPLIAWLRSSRTLQRQLRVCALTHVNRRAASGPDQSSNHAGVIARMRRAGQRGSAGFLDAGSSATPATGPKPPRAEAKRGTRA